MKSCPSTVRPSVFEALGPAINQVLRYILTTLFLTSALAASAQVTITANAPAYGFQVMTGAQRTIPVFPAGTGATTKLVNWSATGATLSCTSNCPAVVSLTITAPGGTCSVTGSVGAYALHSTSDVILTAQSVDDPTQTVSIPFHVCDTSSSSTVDVEPSYNQAFKGQQKILQSYVLGYTNENVAWAITSQPSGGDGTLADTKNRDTLFSATVTGRYTITATSVANGSISGSAIIYVSPNALPRSVTPNKTEPTECYVDPALTGTDYEVGPSQAYTTLRSVPFLTWTAGSIVRIHNEDTTGTSPTTYHEVAEVSGTGTATQPLYICGVADAAGNLPVIDGASAQENPNNNPYLQGLGGFKLMYTNMDYMQGYELGSTGPDYVSITGLRIQDFSSLYSYYPLGGSTLVSYAGGAGIYLRAGQHLHFEGLDMANVGDGIIANNNTVNTGRSITQFHQVIGNHISNFSDNGSWGEHALYMEGIHTLVEGNLFEYPVANDFGDFIKMRGGDSIIRYNLFRGSSGGHVLDYQDMEDTWQFMGVDMNLGVLGDTTCADSIWCTVTTGNITLNHLTENSEALAKDFAYGNVLSELSADSETIQYGSYAAPQECGPCTNMSDRQGKLYFFSNTVDQGGQIFTTANPYSGNYTATAQAVQPSYFAANNIFWTDPGLPFSLNVDATVVAGFQTNMFASGTMNLTTPIQGGSGGWGNYTNAFSYPGAVPLNAHLTGLSAANFLTSTSIPYSSATFAPVPSSPLIGAGTAITNPIISNMPIRFQPNAEQGWVTPRTSPLTIGAVESGVQATLSTVTITPGSTTLAVGASQTYTSLCNYSDGTNVDCTNRSIWSSTNSTSLIFWAATNPVGAAYVVGSGYVQAAVAGMTGSSPFAIGGVALPPVQTPTPPANPPTVTTPTLTFASIATQTNGVAPFTVSATSASSGAVTYSVTSGPATISGSTVTITGTGTVVLGASQAANGNYGTATATTSFTVVAPAPPTVTTPTLTFTSIGTLTYGVTPFAVSATSASSGAVTYSVTSGPATVSGSTVTITGTGTVVLGASQAANGSYGAATATTSFQVVAGTPTLTFASIATQTYGAAPFTVSATSASSGAVTYSVTSGPATVSGSTVTITGTGTVVLGASQAANGSYGAATATTSFQVVAGTPTLAFASIGTQTYGVASFAVSATSASSGAVTYSVTSGPATISGSTVTITGTGTVVLGASQAANGNYGTATAATSFKVVAATPNLAFTPIATQTNGVAPFAVSATSASSGAVTYSVTSGPATISGSTVTITGTGTVVLGASQAANGSYGAATATTSFQVVAGTPTLTFASIATQTYGAAPFAVSATSASSGAVTYSVTSGPATVSGSTVTITGTGTVVLGASQAASGGYAAATATTSFQVVAGTPTLTFASIATQTYGAAPFAVSATSASSGAVTYSVTSGPATIAGSTVTITGTGTVVLGASQAASGSYAAATATTSFQVIVATPNLAFTPIATQTNGVAPFAVSATSASSGAVTYSVTSGPASVSGSTVTITGTGTVVLGASQAANGNYGTATATTSFKVVAATSTLTFTPIATQTYGVAPFAVSATSASSGAVTYSVTSGPATISGSTVTITGTGTVVLGASQAASGSYAAATATTSFQVIVATPNLAFTPIATQTNGVAPFAVSATSASSGAVTYSVTSGPASVSGSTVTITGAGTVVLGASQAANGNYGTATATTSFKVVAATSTLTFTPIATQTYGVAPFAVSATSASSGAVTYSVTSGPATISGSTVTITGTGTVVLGASQAASGSYAAATATTSFQVVVGTPNLTFTPIATQTNGVAPFAVSATSASSGAVTYSVTSGPASVSGSTVTITGAGTVVLGASQAANGNYGTATATTNFKVSAAAANAVSISVAQPPFGFNVIPGSVRRVFATVTNGSTNRVSWAVKSGSATLSSNAGSWVDVTAPTVGSSCSYVMGSGAWTVNSSAQFVVEATSIDDPTKVSDLTFNVCNPKVQVDVVPFYRTLYANQAADVQSIVKGSTDLNVHWAITNSPKGGDGALTDSTLRDAVFSATVPGRYTLTATSVQDPTVSTTAIMYVTGDPLPSYKVTPNMTEPVDCAVDPAMLGTVYNVGPSQTFKTLASVPFPTMVPGSTVRLHNEDTTGSSPTTYHEYVQISQPATEAQPFRLCGVPDKLGNLPVIDATAAQGRSDASSLSGGYGLISIESAGTGLYPNYIGPAYIVVEGIKFQNANAGVAYTAPNGSSGTWSGTSAAIRLFEAHNVAVVGNDIYNNGNGVFSDFTSAADWGGSTIDVLWEGNHLNANGAAGSAQSHQMNLQAWNEVVQFNRIENYPTSASGANIKSRSLGTVIRYNYLGNGSTRQMDLAEAQDSATYMTFAGYLNASPNSFHDLNPSDQYTADLLAAAQEEWNSHFVYGNIYQNLSSTAPIHFGYDTDGTEAARKGNLYWYNNSFYEQLCSGCTGQAWTLFDTQGAGGNNVTQVEYPTVQAYNNVLWGANTALPALSWNNYAAFIGVSGTNLLPAKWGSNNQAGGIGTGWSVAGTSTAYQNAVNLSTHLTGFTSANLSTVSSMPFNATTFILNSNQAGSTNVPSAVCEMPVRFSYLPNVGYAVPRISGPNMGATDTVAEIASTMTTHGKGQANTRNTNCR